MIQIIRNCPTYRSTEYPGRYPPEVEKELLFLLGSPKKNEVLYVFGGKSKGGIRSDIKYEVYPDLISDAHNLPFWDDAFKVVICDPPYSDNDNYILYGNTVQLFYDAWIREAVRVSKKYVATRHVKLLPVPEGCSEWMRIFLTLTPNRFIHLVQVFILDTEL